MTVNLPFPISVQVLPNYLGDLTEPVDAYLIAATAIKNRPLLFTVHTVHGALYSRLPLEAFGGDKQQWGCMGDDIQALEISYLRDYFPTERDGTSIGRYLISFDTFNGGFAQDPEQHKIIHLIQDDEGALYLRTNNECLFKDEHFTEDSGPTAKNKRNLVHYTSES